MQLKMKKCKGECGLTKPDTEFWGGRGKCRICQGKLDKTYREKKKIENKLIKEDYEFLKATCDLSISEPKLETHNEINEVNRLISILEQRDQEIESLKIKIDSMREKIREIEQEKLNLKTRCFEEKV